MPWKPLPVSHHLWIFISQEWQMKVSLCWDPVAVLQSYRPCRSWWVHISPFVTLSLVKTSLYFKNTVHLQTTYGPPGWRSWQRHCIASVPPETLGSSPGSVSASLDLEVHGATQNWPSVVRVREGLAGRDILVLSRTSDSCGRPGAVHADQVARCTVFPLTHWCGWLPGWMRAWLGCVSEDAWLSTFVSPEPVRELQRWDKTVTTNNWTEKGVKNKYFTVW